MSYLKIYFTFVLCLNIMQKAQGEEKKEEKTEQMGGGAFLRQFSKELTAVR